MSEAMQRGFTIVSAIFILVVLAALGAFIVTITTTQQISSALDVQGSRAYQAARSGIEWGVYQVQASAAYNFGHANDPAATSTNLRSCPASPVSFAFPAAPTLKGFSVTVNCTATTDPATPVARTGTSITTNSASTSVTGVGTSFASQLTSGNQIYTSANAWIGTVASIASNTSLTLTANAAVTYTGTYRYLGGPTVFTVTATACNQPDAGSCPNTNALSPPNGNYIERRMEVAF